MEQDLLLYKSTLPWYYEIPIRTDYNPFVIINSKIHCNTDENSTQCLLEKNLNLIQSKIQEQFQIQRDYFTNYNISINRKSRGVLWIGHVATFCCEIVTSDALARQNENVMQVNSNLNKVLNLARENDNNTKLLNDHFNKFAQDSQNITLKINENLKSLQNQILQLKKRPDLSEDLLLSLQNLWQALFQNLKFDNLRHVHALCQSNKLSQSVVPPNLLLNDLKILEDHLNSENHTLAIKLKTELHLFYRLPLTNCIWKNNSLLLKINVPIVKLNTKYIAFKNLPLPMTWENNLCTFTQNEFTVVQAGNEINIMPHNDNNCNTKSFPLCRISRQKNKHEPEFRCVEALFKKMSLENIRKFCEMSCTDATNFVHVTKILHDTYLLTNIQTPLNIQCRNVSRNSKVPITKIGTIKLTLPCGCALIEKEEILISDAFPCDELESSVHPQQIHYIPQIWANLDTIVAKPLHEEGELEINNLTAVINTEWQLTLPVYNLSGKYRITEKDFKLKNTFSEIFNNDTIYLFLITIWLSIITIVILFLIYVILILNTKVDLILKDKQCVPPPRPPRNIRENSEDE